MISDDKLRFTIIIEKNTFDKFKEIAKKEKRSASNLAAKIIDDYIDKNY